MIVDQTVVSIGNEIEVEDRIPDETFVSIEDEIEVEDEDPNSEKSPNNEVTTTEYDFDISGSLVGQSDKSWLVLYDMYRKHSQVLGFSIRLGTIRRVAGPGSREYERYFLCSNQGTTGGNSSVRSNSDSDAIQTKNTSLTRTKCNARVRAKLQDGEWVVVDHIVQHNHVLTPHQWQHHHRSERRITSDETDIIKVMTQAKIPPSIQYRYLSVSSGGTEFVGHIKKDHYNFVHRLKRRGVEGGDASTLINMLSKRQADDPGFYFKVMFDEESRLCRLFWRDSMMKEDYLLYHDVVIFDTTYRTNKYNLICGAFVGINNHWSTTKGRGQRKKVQFKKTKRKIGTTSTCTENAPYTPNPRLF